MQGGHAGPFWKGRDLPVTWKSGQAAYWGGGTGKPTEGGTSMRRDSPLRTCHSQSNNINSIIVKTPQSRDGDYFFETLSSEALGKFTCWTILLTPHLSFLCVF